jgi:anthranilate synthase/aminodeoxychorismate synthase-like glutamine amidotransferase
VILLIDNYDSFVHNLARYFRRLGQETVVVRNDAVTAAQALALRPAAIVLSPGPCTPREAGCSLDVVRLASGQLPLLGVCLGHQAIGEAFGGRVVRAPQPVHGQASDILHAGDGLFAGLPNPLTVGRYHSLVVERRSLPAELYVTAEIEGGLIMAIQHRTLPVFGVQFHPESILTERGFTLLSNFLALAGLEPTGAPHDTDERPPAPAVQPLLPLEPVTF